MARRFDQITGACKIDSPVLIGLVIGAGGKGMGITGAVKDPLDACTGRRQGDGVGQVGNPDVIPFKGRSGQRICRLADLDEVLTQSTANETGGAADEIQGRPPCLGPARAIKPAL